MEGLEDAFHDPANKNNPLIQQAVATPLRNCKRYTNKMPNFARTFLCNRGNVVNDEVLIVTPMEVWVASKEVMDGFKRRKDAMKWKLDVTHSQAELDHLCFEYASALHPRRWASYHDLEVCASGYRRMCDTLIVDPLPTIVGNTVWDDLVAAVRARADMMKVTAADHSDIFNSTYEIFCKLRVSHPEYVAPVALLVWPCINGHGVCPLLQEGLPNPVFKRVTGDMCESLLVDMSSSEAVQQAISGEDVRVLQEQRQRQVARADEKKSKRKQQLDKKREQQAKKSVAKAKASMGRGRSVNVSANNKRPAEPAASSIPPAPMVEKNLQAACKFLGLWTATKAYLIKIEPRNQERLQAWESIALSAALGLQGISLTCQHKARPLKGFCMLRTIFKAESYRMAALKPRASDPDFANNQGIEAAVDAYTDECVSKTETNNDELTDDDLRLFLERSRETIMRIELFLDRNKVSLPVNTHICACSALSETMMSMLAQVGQLGGGIANADAAAEMLFKAAVSQLENIIEPEWRGVLETVDKIKNHPSAEVITDGIAPRYKEYPHPSFLPLYMGHVLCYIVKSLGKTTFILKGVTPQSLPYMSEFVLQVFEGLFVTSDTSKVDAMDATALHSHLFPEMSEWLDHNFGEVCRAIFDEAQRLQRIVAESDAHNFAERREKIKRDFLALPMYKLGELEAFATSVLNHKVTFSAQATMFPNSRESACAYLLEEYDKLHPTAVEALQILQFPTQSVVERLIVAHKPVSEEAASGSGNSIHKPSGVKSLGSTCRRSVQEWWDGVVSLEKQDDTCAADLFSRLPTVTRNALTAALNHHFTQIASQAYIAKESLGGLALVPQVNTKKTARGSADDKAQELFEIVRQEAQINCRLDYWGKVVDLATAGGVSRTNLLPILLQDGKYPATSLKEGLGFSLYLDGAKAQNTKHSSCSLAWHVKLAPENKDISELERLDEGETNPIKKAKLAVRIESARSKRITPTHEIEYSDFQVTSKNEEGTDVTYYFRRPVLVNSSNPANAAILDKKCYRSKMFFDDVELPKRQKAVKSASSFILS